MSKLLLMTPKQFCDATNACKDGRKWALAQPTMADVWDNCPRADWLVWISDKLGHRSDDRTLRLFAIWCARNTPLADGRKTGDLLTDPRSLAALEVAERYAHGNATDDELYAARSAAQAAARHTAWDAARSAAQDVARDAARDAAWDAAWDAAQDAARDAERDATWDAAQAAAWDAQVAYFRTMVTNPFRKEAQP